MAAEAVPSQPQSSSRDQAPPAKSGTFSLREFLAGWVAGVCGLLAGHPLDTVKVRQQVSHTKIASTLRGLRSDGRLALYRGMAFPLVTAGVINSLFFGVFANTRRLLQAYQGNDTQKRTCLEPPSAHWHANVFAAGCAGALGQFPVACPVDLVKIRLQTHSDAGARGVVRCVRELHKLRGLRGFYRGSGVMLARDIPACASYVLVYEHAMASCQGRRTAAGPPMLCPLLAGGLAGIASWALILPLDVVKSRVQADDPTRPRYRGAWDCARRVARHGGARAFGVGFWMMSTRAFIVNAATFLGYEWCLDCFEWLELF